MLYGICNLSVISLRLEPLHTSEMTSQILFGEHFKILEKRKNWSKIRLAFDTYEGFIDNKQFEEISEELYHQLSIEEKKYSGEFIDFVSNVKNELITITMGCVLPFFKKNTFQISGNIFNYNGKIFTNKYPKNTIVANAFLFINTPYLWGGKTPFGLDCSGFTQLVYKLCGYPILRDAHQQATQGEGLSFIEESEPGDLAFFDDEEGNITHVGIIMNDYKIIHVYGKVRIDYLDHSGIYNIDTQKHTHKLRVIKKII